MHICIDVPGYSVRLCKALTMCRCHLQVCGQGQDVEGDGVVPCHSALLEVGYSFACNACRECKDCNVVVGPVEGGLVQVWQTAYACSGNAQPHRGSLHLMIGEHIDLRRVCCTVLHCACLQDPTFISACTHACHAYLPHWCPLSDGEQACLHTVHCRHTCMCLQGAKHVVLDGVYHSMSQVGSFSQPSGHVWYGSEDVIDTWLGQVVSLVAG